MDYFIVYIFLQPNMCICEIIFCCHCIGVRMLRISVRSIMNLSRLILFTNTNCIFFDVLLTVHLSIFISVINQLDAQNFCFTISLFHASTCFEYMCSKHVEA